MTNQSNNLNYLAIIGAQRSGSTFLYNVLNQHPDIKMYQPIRPESKYFLQNKSTGKQDLIDIFGKINNEKFIGEKCTSYIESPEIGDKILGLFPQSKLLVILRNPIDRAISNYHFSKDNGLETRTLKDAFINKEKPPNFKKNISVNPFDYINRSRYYKHLMPFKDKFGENLKVVILEQLLKEKIEPDIFDFLGLNHVDVSIDKAKKINTSLPQKNIDLKEVRSQIETEIAEDLSLLKDFLNIDLNKYWSI